MSTCSSVHHSIEACPLNKSDLKSLIMLYSVPSARYFTQNPKTLLMNACLCSVSSCYHCC